MVLFINLCKAMNSQYGQLKNYFALIMTTAGVLKVKLGKCNRHTAKEDLHEQDMALLRRLSPFFFVWVC